MGVYRDHVLPRLNDVMLSGVAIDRVRARVCSGLTGEVVEIGFGSGRNVPHYPPSVTRVWAVDPAAGSRDLAAERVANSGIPVEYVGATAEQLPLDDASVDHVLTTFTLCSIADVERALAEICRVLRPGGALHFAEHGLAPDDRVSRWQHRLTPLQRRMFGGCHLDRPIDDLIADAGLDVEQLDTYCLGRPKSYTHFFEGVAVRP
jgi:ubiquinone/menaquinone biosynthesis C-methylase UbiE